MGFRLLRVDQYREIAAVADSVQRQKVHGIGGAGKHALSGAILRVLLIGNLIGILTKPFSMVLLGRRVTALLRRSGQTVSPDIMTFGDVTVDFSGYTAKGPEGKIDITPKEIDLLKLLVEHKGLVLTRSQMLDNLWGADYPIIDRTIDTYIKNLRKKLRLDCIVTVKGIGYKFEVET